MQRYELLLDLNQVQPLVRVKGPYTYQPSLYLHSSTYIPTTAGLDYAPTNATVILPALSPNGTSRCVTITIIDDDEMEERESFFINLNNPTRDVITVQEGENILTVLILDDDSKYTYKYVWYVLHCVHTVWLWSWES